MGEVRGNSNWPRSMARMSISTTAEALSANTHFAPQRPHIGTYAPVCVSQLVPCWEHAVSLGLCLSPAASSKHEQ
jgi:hypothetical protein